jgi:hypothetical protein
MLRVQGKTGERRLLCIVWGTRRKDRAAHRGGTGAELPESEEEERDGSGGGWSYLYTTHPQTGAVELSHGSQGAWLE